jgi:hypothetical protein
LTDFQYEGHEGKIAMKDMFDMISGTSTGSIMAAGFSMPKSSTLNGEVVLSDKVPGYFAKEIIDIYRNDNSKIFDKHPITTSVIMFLSVLLFPLFIYFGVLYGRAIFDNKFKQE